MSRGGNHSQSNRYCVTHYYYYYWAQGGGLEECTIILAVHQKRGKRAPEVWAPIGQVTQNLEWGVSVGYGERNNVALCASGAGKTNRFPWKEIVFRLHLRRPHKADQSHVCCVRWGGRGGGAERRSASGWPHTCEQLNIHSIVRQGEVICDVPHQAFAESNTLSNYNPWSETKSATVLCVLLLSWDNMARTALQAEHHSVRLTDWLQGVVH